MTTPQNKPSAPGWKIQLGDEDVWIRHDGAEGAILRLSKVRGAEGTIFTDHGAVIQLRDDLRHNDARWRLVSTESMPNV